MELDQAVVRSSFRHYGVQPHFDDEKVQWWFGDASKSLSMLPPEEYFGTFDLVVIDLLSYTFEALRVGEDEESLVDYMMKLLKPDGIMARQEDFLARNNVDFAKYVVDLDVIGLLHLGLQSITLGSNNLDFIRKKPIDHKIDALVYQPPGTSGHHYTGLWGTYRQNSLNRRLGTNSCTGDDKSQPSQEEATNNQLSSGILSIVEVENTTLSLEDSSLVTTSIQKALHEAGYSGIIIGDSFISNDSAETYSVVTFVMKEGYVVVRSRPEHHYCALDFQLWHGIGKQEQAMTKLVMALGGNVERATSSFRITTGGMHFPSDVNDKNTQTGNKPVSPTNGLCDPWNSSVSTASIPLEREHSDTVLNEILDLTQESDPMVFVVCANQSTECPAFDSIMSTSSEPKRPIVFPLWFCNGVETQQELIRCQQEIQGTIVSHVYMHGKQINGIVIDPNAPREMGQIIHRIFSNNLVRSELLADHYVLLAPTPALSPDESSWRNALLERFRTEIAIFNPLFHARVDVLNIKSNSELELGVFSAGNPSFYENLLEIFARIETKTQNGLSLELRNSKVGLISHVPDFEPSYIASTNDYKMEASYEQWLSQHPVGRQSVVHLHMEPTIEILEGEGVLVNDVAHALGGSWLSGQVLRRREDGVYDVKLVSGDVVGIERQGLRQIMDRDSESPLEFGEHVLFYFAEENVWYQGLVQGVNDDGTYTIMHFTDPRNPLMNMSRNLLVRRLEPRQAHDERSKLSTAEFREILQEGLSQLVDSQFTMTEVGDGCVLIALTAGVQVVASWDGRFHFDINVFVMDDNNSSNKPPKDMTKLLAKSLMEQKPDLISIVQSDDHPRGFGRVVNTREDLESVWFGSVTYPESLSNLHYGDGSL